MVLKGVFPQHTHLRLALSPFTAAEIEAQLAERGLGPTLIETTVEGATMGGERGSWVGVMCGAAVGLGAVAWASWHSRPASVPHHPISIFASMDPPDTSDHVDLPMDVSPTNDDVESAEKVARVVSAPFARLEEAEAELIRLTANAPTTSRVPYAVVQDTETGFYYVCDIQEHNEIGSSLRFVSYGIKLGPKQSEQAAIPPQASLIQNGGQPIRTVGVWSETQYVILTTTPIGNTPGHLAEFLRTARPATQDQWTMVYRLEYELHKDGKPPARADFIMVTSATRSHVQLLIPIETLRQLKTDSEIAAWLTTGSRHPTTREDQSFARAVQIRAKPTPGGTMVYFPRGFGSASIQYYSSGDVVFNSPQSGPLLPAYIPKTLD